MSLRRTSLAALTLVALAPVASVACGSAQDRNYIETDASLGGGSGTGGGNTGGSAGSSTGGNAGSSTGGSAGTGGITDGGIPDGAVGCSSPADCDDGDECSGVETCTNGYCQLGTPKKDGDPCASPDGGAWKCFLGACTKNCTADKDCDDGNVCTGTEICLQGSGTCATGTPLSCDDNDDCTTNECDPEKGCFYPVIDNDGDGQASTSIGACGKDCDDNDKTIYDGAAELCDGKDNNCNGQKDELAPTWYVDCDADSFAPNLSGSVQGCDKPTQASASCNGVKGATWTAKAPGKGATDCWDLDADAHPYTAANDSQAFHTVGIAGAPVSVDFDYNCDGKEEQRYTTTGISSAAPCTWVVSGGFGQCTGPYGWTSSVAPACGKSATYTSCSSLLGCSRATGSRTQECR